MIKNSKIWCLQITIFFLSIASFSQKSNETNAVTEFNKFIFFTESGKRMKAFKALKKAKEYIDLASNHPDTKDSQKSLLYLGSIYIYLPQGKFEYPELFLDVQVEDAFYISMNALQRAYQLPDKKFRFEVKQKAGFVSHHLGQAARGLFDEEQYYEAMLLYEQVYNFGETFDFREYNFIYNAGLCAEIIRDVDRAIESYKKCFDHNHNIDEVSLKLANLMITANRQNEALEYLLIALPHHPNSKDIYYSIGTIYMGQGADDKALEYLLKAVDIDPEYDEAHYQIGSNYFNRGSVINKQIESLGEGHVDYSEMVKRRNAWYEQAIVPFEVYLRSNPTDKAVLSAMITIYDHLNDPEKVSAYSQRLQGLD